MARRERLLAGLDQRGRMLQSRDILGLLRLATGLILFAYLLTHSLNHALGLISLDAMEQGRLIFLLVWRSIPGTLLLYTSLAAHMLLALWSLYRRRSLRMPTWEATQLLLGLAIPPLLAVHIIGTRLAHELYGTDDSYRYVLLAIWVFKPADGLQQTIVLLVAWLHGCIGLHFWLRLKGWYARALPFEYATALLVPVLGLLGFAQGGREVARLAQDPAWLEQSIAAIGVPDAAGVAQLYGIRDGFILGFLGLLFVTLLARAARTWLIRRRAVTISYPEGRSVEIQPGTTILEASRIAGIPHASVCGGRGRCSTCRVRISAGLEQLADASDAERRVLERVGAAPNVRLACQTRPTADVAVVPLLPATASPRDARPKPGYLQGHEEEIAILFADLRAFTQLAEKKLPYDVVFLLNRYFRAMGMAVESAGGRLDKFIGDGVMALFGVGGRPDDGCRRALAAARGMAENLEEINAALAHDLAEPLRIGIGIHAGPVIVGEMGHGRTTSVTAIGDAVNIASRLETLTKDYRCQLVISETVARHASLDVGDLERHEISVRGRDAPLAIHVVTDARSLPAGIGAPTAAPRRERRGLAGAEPRGA